MAARGLLNGAKPGRATGFSFFTLQIHRDQRRQGLTCPPHSASTLEPAPQSLGHQDQGVEGGASELGAAMALTLEGCHGDSVCHCM